ncbi:Protein MARD1 [Mucuna pruriens]|uniref:Protein MARD1 n=1 Tax=Mucuna pruriens TaxID=157652 RepID=A0A371FEI1_MUCPR|nr:Protein MARD1 [Mucuna pruriens]
MLLRNRSRAVTKPSLMGDHSSQPCPNQGYKRTIPSLFSPKFRDFTVKCLSGAEALRSPTSILDTRALSPFGNPFSHDNKTEPINIISPRMPSEGIGLALVGALKDENLPQNSATPRSGTVLFGTKLRVKIPSLPPPSPPPPPPLGSTTCAAYDIGVKTTDSQKYTKDSPLSVGTGVMTLSEMELSEEYTCVIAHGPNPRTTHIFDNCIVESYCSLPNNPHSPSLNFLSFCHTCKKHLEQTKDIFIYRGDKAFCSQECRHKEMVLDGAGTSEFDRY